MDEQQSARHPNITHTALLVELGLGLLALLISWATGHWPWGSAAHSGVHEIFLPLAVGSAAALPVFFALLLMDQLPAEWFDQLRSLVDRQLVPLFRHTNSLELLAISLAAGVGEELFFRGLIQAALIDWFGSGVGAWCGLMLASALFGLCHWLSPTYAVLATAMGALLGLLMLTTGSLLAPIAMHTVYDFLALLYLVRWRRNPLTTEHDAGA